ncbi:ABC transporter substrate-binding protein [Streptomyces sp. WMMB 322]|uniref:ABC transporter substrate-binding protein n=1 Tax=Streptomyces sp. WMMB 322 TaxID=1286821 RepID=UPI0006E1EC65|nr:ABC transporter substrate-binding protein [Streptomyces sp. WMMB 322]SCK42028.1 peptide/nickel transport system substrate-binding protein [Streptomyces sp. WMMB 322]
MRLRVSASSRTASLTAAALALAVTGCASLTTSATEVGGVRMSDTRPVKDGGTLTVAFKSDPDKLDPSLGSTLVGRSVFAAMCQKLYDTDAKNRIKPQLAAGMPKVSDDGRKVVIGVRRGARFSDGTPLDAKAVETSLKRHRDLPASARASELEPVESIEAVGDHEVELRLKEPYEPLLGALADRSGMVMSPRALKKYGEDFAAHPSCVGPFRFDERVTGDRIVLEKDPNYYAASNVHLKRIVYRTIVDGNVRLANLRSGDAQVSDQTAPLEVQSALTDDKLQLFNSPTLGYQGLTVNVGNARGLGEKPGRVNSSLARDKRIREAFELSLDRRLINRIVFQGMYDTACGPVAPSSELGTKTTCPGRDLGKARRLLREADAKGQVPVELTISNTVEDMRLGQVIQAMAKDAGFRVKLRPTEFTTLLEHADRGDFEAVSVGWSGRLDPAGNIDAFAQTLGSENRSGISDEHIDSLIEEGRRTADPEERRGIYRDVTRAINDQHALIYLYRQRNYVVATKDVAGLRVFGDGLIRVENAGYVRGANAEARSR